MEGLNLKTGEIKFARKRRGGWLSLILSGGIILLTAGAYWYLHSVSQATAKEKVSVKEEIDFQEKMFLQDEFWQVYDFESRLQVLGRLLEDKSSPTEALGFLSKNTLAETVFRDLKISFNGKEMVFECAVTVPSYSFLAKQVEAYRMMENVLSVDFASGSVVEQGVDSVLKIYLKKENKKEEPVESGIINFNAEK